MEEPDEADPPGSPRVLLVDDHASTLLALDEVLHQRLEAVEVETCDTCERALASVLSCDYDAVVADVGLPDGSGLDILAHTRIACPETPVILVTGHDEKDLALRALRGGAYDLVLKPVDADDFAHTVELAIERRRMRREIDAQHARARRNAEELERIVLHRTRELRDHNRLKDEFLATVSHELRTPLTPILGWARLLKSPRIDKATFDEAVASIERNARAQSQLIDDLLDVSRIVTGKLRLDLQSLELHQVIDAAVDTVVPQARAKSVTIETRYPEAMPKTIPGDPQRLRQVFCNLLSNAVKFTKSGGSVLVVVESRGATIAVSIVDTGCGIPSELLPYVFDRFRQGQGPGSRLGLGLGLAIVKHLVELHGGTVRADSAGKDRGARFTVALPARSQTNDQVFDRPSLLRPDPPPASQCLHGMHVLLVEDTRDTQQVLTATLSIAGARVTAVATVLDALEVVDRDPPHVMLCDIGLGDEDEDGYSFIKKMRSRPPQTGGTIPAIALTALAKPEDRLQALSAGFQMHFAKPGPPNLPLVLARLVLQAAATRRPPAPARN